MLRFGVLFLLLLSLFVFVNAKDPVPLSPTSSEVSELATFAIGEMNKIMPADHPLTLIRVVSAQISMQTEDHTMYVLGLEYEVDGFEEQKKVMLKRVNDVLSFEEWGGGC